VLNQFKVLPFISWILLITILALTSFNKENTYFNNTDQKFNNLITNWVTFYLNTESKDFQAYPPISSDRLFKMNYATYAAQRIAASSYTLDCDEMYSLLDFVYAEQIKLIYEKDPDILRKVKLQQHVSPKDISPEIKKISQMAINITMAQANPGNETEITQRDANSENEFLSRTDTTAGILPNWGLRNTVIVAKSLCKADVPYQGESVGGLHKDALTIYSISQNLSNEKKWIAEFWSDDLRGLTYTPVSRWFSIATQIISLENLEYTRSLELLAMLSVGLHDAAIICWHEKYLWNTVRPEQYIQKHIDPSWQPFHPTPNFPAYPSGHAVFGATACSILEAVIGPNYTFTDKSHNKRSEFNGKERTFASIKEMGVENAYSRLYMGVHYPEDCEAGLKLGYQIGDILIKNYESMIEKHIDNQTRTNLCSLNL
jgi:hypothetical protein